jgi:hypothetical protein
MIDIYKEDLPAIFLGSLRFRVCFDHKEHVQSQFHNFKYLRIT